MGAACRALALVLFALVPCPQARSFQDTADIGLASARTALAEGTATGVELGRHVATLLEADDLETLGNLLADGPDVVSQVIMETLAVDDDLRFVEAVLQLAAAAEAQPIAEQARQLLRDQASRHDQVRSDLVAMLSNGELDPLRRLTIIGTLGRCRDLAVVPALLAHLAGPAQNEVLVAFEQLSGHELPEGAEAQAFWTELWARQEQDGLTRDVLLEEGHALQRARWAAANADRDAERSLLVRRLRVREGEVAEARIAALGGKIDRLIEALQDEYASVRQAAAQSLADHPAHEKATVAIPALLKRLGHGGALLGTNGGHVAEPLEQNAEVRATIVSALGSLGRDRLAVMTCLLAELSHQNLVVARAAVAALSKVKNQPMVVRPLLDFLSDEGLDQDTTVQVLGIIAHNDPVGVLEELNRRLSVATDGNVRAVLVQAMIASQELHQAVVVLSVLVTSAEKFEVRFALARWLGERLSALPLDAAPRPLMMGVIESLLSDADASVRAQAAKSLGESGDPRAAELLTERAKQEVSGSVLLDIVSALGQVGSLECAVSIGWIRAHDTVSDTAALDERARKALRAIGRMRPWSDWMIMARALAGAEAHGLALVVINEILAPRAEGMVIPADVAEQARGLKALQLVAIGATQDAHDLLLQLEDEGKAFPPRERRLDMLAQTSRDLALPSEAADWVMKLLEGRGAADARFDELQRSLAGDLLAARRHGEALELLERLRAEQPSDNQLMLWHGQALMSAGRDGEARTLLERLLARLTETETAIMDLTRAALEQLADPETVSVAGEQELGDQPAQPTEGVEPPATGVDGKAEDGSDAEQDFEAEGDGGGTGNR